GVDAALPFRRDSAGGGGKRERGFEADAAKSGGRRLTALGEGSDHRHRMADRADPGPDRARPVEELRWASVRPGSFQSVAGLPAANDPWRGRRHSRSSNREERFERGDSDARLY